MTAWKVEIAGGGLAATLRLAGVLAVGFGLAACGSSRSPVYGPGDVDRPPELLGCPSEELGVGPKVVVRLSLVVGTDGTVESARHRPTSRSEGMTGPSPDQATVQRAREIAMKCAYTPAVRDGMPVRYRLMREFSFAYSPGG